MTGKKSLENRIDDLEPEDDGGGDGGLLIAMTSVRGDESPHPALTVERYPDLDRGGEQIAHPQNRLPEPYASESILSIISCGKEDTHGKHGDFVCACELWEGLNEDDLHAEKRYREDHGEPIPDILAEY